MERRGSLIYFLLYIRQGKESVKLLGWGREGGGGILQIYNLSHSKRGAGVPVGAKGSRYCVSPPQHGKVR